MIMVFNFSRKIRANCESSKLRTILLIKPQLAINIVIKAIVHKCNTENNMNKSTTTSNRVN